MKAVVKPNGPYVTCDSLEVNWVETLSAHIHVSDTILLLSRMMNVFASISIISTNWCLYSEETWWHFSGILRLIGVFNARTSLTLCSRRAELSRSVITWFNLLADAEIRLDIWHISRLWKWMDFCYCTVLTDRIELHDEILEMLINIQSEHWYTK